MTSALQGVRIAVLATEGVEQVELTEPVKALREAGAEVHLIEPDGNPVQAFHHLDRGDVFPADKSLSDVSEDDYDGLLLPGGVANPDALRLRPEAVRLVRAFFEADKPVAAICHAPWLLIEADVVKGRTLTSWPSLRKDLENAGATWVDKQVQVDQRLITSRKPDDLPAFSRRIVLDFGSKADESKMDRMVEQTFPASDPLPGP